MLICEWFVYYGEIKDKLVLTVENIINNEYIRGRADRLLVSLDCARHVSLVQKTTRYAGGK